MIANYTNHAANERTFLAWIRTGLAVAAFGFFLVKLDVLVDVVGSGSPPHLLAESAGAFVAAAARYAGLAMVAIGIAIIARSGAVFERTRRAINRDDPAVPCGAAAFGGARDRRGDFLRLSRGALSLGAHDSNPNYDRRIPWIREPTIGPAQLCAPSA